MTTATIYTLSLSVARDLATALKMKDASKWKAGVLASKLTAKAKSATGVDDVDDDNLQKVLADLKQNLEDGAELEITDLSPDAPENGDGSGDGTGSDASPDTEEKPKKKSGGKKGSGRKGTSKESKGSPEKKTPPVKKDKTLTTASAGGRGVRDGLATYVAEAFEKATSKNKGINKEEFIKELVREFPHREEIKLRKAFNDFTSWFGPKRGLSIHNVNKDVYWATKS